MSQIRMRGWRKRVTQCYRYVNEMRDLVLLTPKETTKIWNEKVVGGTHKGKIYGMDSQIDIQRLQSGLEGIGLPRQAEAIDGVQIAGMSRQISKLTRALAVSEARRIVEQKSTNETVEQIKEQMLNLARHPKPSCSSGASTSTDDSEVDFIDSTP